jgi:hypothetical protein
MKRALWVLVACGTPSPTRLLLDAPPRQIDMDVVVDSRSVTVYTNATDGTREQDIAADTFPADGACVGDGDAFLDPSGSCVEKLTMLDGRHELGSVDPRPDGKSVQVDVTTLHDPILELVGCGGRAVIPLGVAPLTVPTIAVTTDASTGTLTATWSGASSVSLLFGFTVGDVRCRTSTSPYVYTSTGPPITAYDVVGALALDGPTLVDTELGPARVWRGADSYVQLTP